MTIMITLNFGIVSSLLHCFRLTPLSRARANDERVSHKEGGIEGERGATGLHKPPSKITSNLFCVRVPRVGSLTQLHKEEQQSHQSNPA